jgi:hypothetical protein
MPCTHELAEQLTGPFCTARRSPHALTPFHYYLPRADMLLPAPVACADTGSVYYSTPCSGFSFRVQQEMKG